MPRYSHFLGRTKGNRQPSSWLAVAVETVSEPAQSGRKRNIDRLTGWSAIWTHKDSRGRQWSDEFSGNTADFFWHHIEQICSNGGLHTMFCERSNVTWGVLQLWENLELGKLALIGSDPAREEKARTKRRRQEQGIIVLEDPPVIIDARPTGAKGRFRVVDLANYGMSCSVTDQSAALNAATIHYSVASLIDTLDSRKLGSLQSTAGSQSLYSFKHSHMRHAIYVHTEPSALSLERNALFGGRCEVARIGRCDGPIYALDFRAFYPSILLASGLPTQLLHVVQYPGFPPRPEELESAMYIADVTIETDAPCAPMRYHHDIIYPVGRWRVCLCKPEVEIVQRVGRVLDWHEVAYYRAAPAFAEFAAEWIAIREDAERANNKPLAQWSKRVANSLHGKMGQHNRQWIDTPDVQWDEPYSVWYQNYRDQGQCRFRSIAEHVQRQVDLGEHPESCPAIAAWVTSLGRAILWNAIECAGRENVFYYDTDSLWVGQHGYERLVAAGQVSVAEAGKLRLEACHQEAYFFGQKNYSVAGKSVCAGRPGQREQIGGENPSHVFRQGIKESIQSHKMPRAESTVRKYARGGAYRHGIVMPDGTVRPMEVGMS